MIHIARVYEPPGKRDGCRVLVDRLWPRGIKRPAAQIGEWLKEVAPSNELRKWFAHKPERWAGFQKRYRGELAKKKDLLESLRALERQHGTLTLLFGAKNEQYNQAVVLRDLLRAKT